MDAMDGLVDADVQIRMLKLWTDRDVLAPSMPRYGDITPSDLGLTRNTIPVTMSATTAATANTIPTFFIVVFVLASMLCILKIKLM
jgi:hypothetical protein